MVKFGKGSEAPDREGEILENKIRLGTRKYDPVRPRQDGEAVCITVRP